MVPKLSHGSCTQRVNQEKVRDILYWSEINDDVERLISTFSLYNSCKPNQQRELRKLHDVPERQ